MSNTPFQNLAVGLEISSTTPGATLLPERGMRAQDACRRVRDELRQDDPPGSNLGSFVTPHMDPWAERLILENLGKNLVCDSEYRQSKVIHDRMVETLALLYGASEAPAHCGTATAGSSEAIQLWLLAHKLSWRNRSAAAGKPVDRPNLVAFSDSHVCWDKLARFFDVELRKVPLSKAGARYDYSVEAVRERVDENTICVGAVVGTTYTGACHPVAAINSLLESIEAERGWEIPIHVDAAAGGFLLPFMDAGARIAWDFRLSHVRSINVSGHKYGLVFPGIGWLLFRDSSCLPRELVFDAPYLGGPLDTFTLNFSRSAAPIIAQYYTFICQGREGFRAVVARCGELARSLAAGLEEIACLELVSDLELSIVCFRPAASSGVDATELSRRLRDRGWVVPAYGMPEGGEGDTVRAPRAGDRGCARGEDHEANPPPPGRDRGLCHAPWRGGGAARDRAGRVPRADAAPGRLVWQRDRAWPLCRGDRRRGGGPDAALRRVAGGDRLSRRLRAGFPARSRYRRVLLGELNPRITGLTPLTMQIAAEVRCVPLLLLHLLEWSDLHYEIDLDEANARFRGLAGTRGASQLILKQTAEGSGVVTHEPASGIWQLGKGGGARFARPAFEPSAIVAEDEALVVRTANQGSARSRGACLARLIAKGRMMTDEHRLAPRAHAWIDALTRTF